MDEGTAADRYRDLANQLGAEMGRARGWKSRVAERLGVHPSYLSRVLSGAKTAISNEVIERACENLGVRRDFFSESEEEPDYRDYLKGNEPPPWAPMSPAQADARWMIVQDEAVNFLVTLARNNALGATETELREEQLGDIRSAAASLLSAVHRLPTVMAALQLEEALAPGDDPEELRLAGLRLTEALRLDRQSERLVRVAAAWRDERDKKGKG